MVADISADAAASPVRAHAGKCAHAAAYAARGLCVRTKGAIRTGFGRRAGCTQPEKLATGRFSDPVGDHRLRKIARKLAISGDLIGGP